MIETDKPLMDAASVAQSPVDTQPSCAAESRLDLVTGQWSIFAPNRSDRPDEFVATTEAINPRVECPFCSGNEHTTPPAVWVGRIENGLCRPNLKDRATKDWSVRVVPNRYPAVVASQSQPKPPENATLLVREAVSGGHEVFIESRQHLASLSELDPAEVHLTFLAYRDRLKYWHAVPEISYVNIFKNVGKKAGASLRHCHSQLIATDKIPVTVQTSVGRMHRHRAETGCCLHCDLIRAERKANQRVVWQNESLIAFCPFASPLPMLLRITSQQHQSRFEDLDDGMIDSVSRLVHRAVSWLEQIRPRTAYNVCLSTQPSGISDPSDSFHWSIDLFPRMTQIAGFEWSSGCTINPVLPEVAATCYRKIADSENPRKLDS